MKVNLCGQVIDKHSKPYVSKDGEMKTSYTLKVYDGRTLQNISVQKFDYDNFDIGSSFEKEVSLFVKGTYSLYIKND